MTSPIYHPQHLKKKCSVEEFNALEAGDKGFEIRLANFEVNNGDLITYVEVDQNGKTTGRQTVRKVTYVEQTKDLEDSLIHGEEDHYGWLVLSLNEPDIKTLRELFASNYAMAIIVEKKDGTDWELIGGPQFWPMLICPDLSDSGIINELRIDKWPRGLYSVHLRMTPEIKGPDEPIGLTISDSFIIVMIEDKGEEMIGIEIDTTALIIGKTISITGETVVPMDPESVLEIYEKAAEQRDEEDEHVLQTDFPVFDGELTEEQLQKYIIEAAEREGWDDPDLFDDAEEEMTDES